MISEETFLDNWYDWEVVEENLKMDISPEAMVAINSGFGTSRGIPNMTGELQWNEKDLIFEIGNLRIRRSKKVRFFKDAALFEITDLNTSIAAPKKVIMKDSKIKHLYLNTDVYQLDNSNGPIYKAIKQFGIELDLQTVVDYIFFFFYNVKGRHGRFYPVASFEQLQPLINISSGNNEMNVYHFNKVNPDSPELPDLNYSITSNMIQNSSDESAESPSTQVIGADEVVVVFKGSIFITSISIAVKDGMVSLSNEKLLYEGAPEH